jgi:hypothetical protein
MHTNTHTHARQGRPGFNEVKEILDDERLRQMFFGGGWSSFSLWQGYVRSAGHHATISRVVVNMADNFQDGLHYKMQWTVRMGTDETQNKSYFCHTSKLSGSKRAGRLVAVERVSRTAWEPAEQQTVKLAEFAAQVHVCMCVCVRACVRANVCE